MDKKKLKNKSFSFSTEESDLYDFINNFLVDSIPEATGNWSTYIKNLIKLDIATRLGKNPFELDFSELNKELKTIKDSGKSIKNYFPRRNWGNFEQEDIKESNNISDDILELLNAQIKTQKMMEDIILAQQESLLLERDSNNYLKQVISSNIMATKELTETFKTGISVNGIVTNTNEVVNNTTKEAELEVKQEVENSVINLDDMTITDDNDMDFDDYF